MLVDFPEDEVEPQDVATPLSEGLRDLDMSAPENYLPPLIMLGSLQHIAVFAD